MKTYHPVHLVRAVATVHGVQLYDRIGRTGVNFQAENRPEISHGLLRFGVRTVPKINCVFAANATLEHLLFKPRS